MRGDSLTLVKLPLLVPICSLLVLAGCAGSADEDSPLTQAPLPDSGVESDSELTPDSGSPAPDSRPDPPPPGPAVGRPCSSDADCGDPELGCLPPPLGRCALRCSSAEPCPGAACGQEGLCPLCGDGLCDAGEQANPGICPSDCQQSTGWQIALTLKNPSSGATLAGRIFLPQDASGDKPYPAVVLVPGGTGAGESFVVKGTTDALVAAGIIALTVDLDGRGQSEGSEDQCGQIHQDALQAFVQALAARPEVQAERIGMLSNSFGITCASGMLARYAETSPVTFLIDYEGPANRNDTGHCDASDTGHITDQACDDDAWWSEREASEHIKQLRVPYLRIQHERDHAQPDNDHALLMINNATAQLHGGSGRSPWTLVNLEPQNTPNRVYTPGAPPVWLQNSSGGPSEVELIQRMLAAFAPDC